jgi:hypothetical protein
MDKPFAPACEENKQPILEVIAPRLGDARSLLEIGSCTGQHAVHFAPAMPHLTWQCSDVAPYLPGMRLWLDDSPASNLPAPIELDVDGPWPDGPFDAVFSANTAHIMSLAQVQRMFMGVGRLLPAGGPFLLYGPFSDGGRHTSPSNAAFDRSLRLRDPLSGVRDLDELRAFAGEAGLTLVEDVAMPVNNRTLVWRKDAQ